MMAHCGVQNSGGRDNSLVLITKLATQSRQCNAKGRVMYVMTVFSLQAVFSFVTIDVQLYVIIHILGNSIVIHTL